MSLLRDLPALARSIGPIAVKAIASGRIFKARCVLTEPDPDILVEYDVEIPLSDGTSVTANVFRSKRAAAQNERVPIIMCAHPYDNRLIPALGRTPLGGAPQQYRLIPQQGRPAFSTLTSWESPDPNFWVPAGYAVVNMNMPGYANSGGTPSLFSPAQAQAFGEAIDWIGDRDWSTGRVGLSGVSYLAISQYMVAAGQTDHGVPRCLAAISPWEGVTDFCQDLFFEGGIEEQGFPVFWWYTEVKPTINTPAAELIANEGQLPHEMAKKHPFYDDYWKSKNPRLEDIDLPMLVCASFSDQGLHTRGSFRAFNRARSQNKWLYTHRSLKWDAYYSKEASEVMRAFFDCFLKDDTENGTLDRAPIRLEVRSARDVIHEVRGEREWPLARTEYKKLYLGAGGEHLREESASEASEISYDARKGSLRFVYTFQEDTEISGYPKLRLHVETRPDRIREGVLEDMALFVGIEKLDRAGNVVPFYGPVGSHRDLVSRGLLKVSRRALDEATSTEWEPVLRNDAEQLLSPGEIVPVEIGLLPSATFFSRGESIRLVVSGHEIVRLPPFVKANDCNRGTHTVHVGGDYDSCLVIPVIPPIEGE
jgi:putative CocE/NonD family hydrolase